MTDLEAIQGEILFFGASVNVHKIEKTKSIGQRVTIS